MGRPRILRILTRLNIGGPSFQAILLTRRLREHGFDTLLAVGEPDVREGDLRERAIREGIPVVSIPALGRRVSLPRDTRALGGILRLIRRWRPQVVHTHMMKAGLLGRLAAFASGVPVRVHTFHGHVFSRYFSSPVSRGIVATESGLATLTHRLVAVGPKVRQEICDRYRIAPPGKVVTIRLGVPLPPRAGPRGGPPAVGFVGRLVEVKDPMLFVRVASRLRGEIPSLRIRIAGDGPLREAVRRASMEGGSGDALEWVGWTDEMVRFYEGIDLLILTSRAEGTPRSILEAQAAGLPVVATDVGAVRDLFTIRRWDGEMGYCEEGILIRGRDPAALARVAAELLRDPDERRRMGEAGRRRVERDHSEDRLVRETEALYRDLLREKGLT